MDPFEWSETVFDHPCAAVAAEMRVSELACAGLAAVTTTGVAINEAASVELPGIQGIWSLRQHFTSAFDKVLFRSMQRVHAIWPHRVS